jgi:hypothetical protein
MKTLSKIISIIFHPMLMPTLGVFLIFQAGTHLSLLPFEAKRIIYLTVFISTFIMPVSLLPLFLQLKVISSIQMETARERIIPVFVTGIFYFLGYLLLKRMGVLSVLGSFILASLMAVFIAVAITFFWKISMHMIAIGGLTGVMLAMAMRFNLDLTFLLSLLILASGIIASARLYVGAHNQAQIYAGFILGLVIVFSSIWM